MMAPCVDYGPVFRSWEEQRAKKREAFDFARHNLSEFIRAEAEGIMRQYGVSMHAHCDAPETYIELLDMWDRSSGMCIDVSNMHCDNTIYTTPEVNHLFRFWHDWLHLQYSADFSLSGELEIGAIHCKAVADFYGSGSMEHRLMIADTIGQSTFEAVTGAFPKDQRAFAWRFVHQ